MASRTHSSLLAALLTLVALSAPRLVSAASAASRAPLPHNQQASSSGGGGSSSNGNNNNPLRGHHQAHHPQQHQHQFLPQQQAQVASFDQQQQQQVTRSTRLTHSANSSALQPAQQLSPQTSGSFTNQRTSNELHFGAKVALSVLLLFVLLVISSTCLDLRMRRATSGHHESVSPATTTALPSADCHCYEQNLAMAFDAETLAKQRRANLLEAVLRAERWRIQQSNVGSWQTTTCCSSEQLSINDDQSQPAQKVHHQSRSNHQHRELFRQLFLAFSLCHSISVIFERSGSAEQRANRSSSHAARGAQTTGGSSLQQVSPSLARCQAKSHRNRVHSLSSISEQMSEATCEDRSLTSDTTCFECAETHPSPQPQLPDNQSVDSLHGLRFLSMIWIIVVHSYSLATRWSFFADGANLDNVYKTVATQLLSNGTFACDSFFFTGGFLLAYLAFPASNVSPPSSPSSSSASAAAAAAAAAVASATGNRSPSLSASRTGGGAASAKESKGKQQDISLPHQQLHQQSLQQQQQQQQPHHHQQQQQGARSASSPPPDTLQEVDSLSSSGSCDSRQSASATSTCLSLPVSATCSQQHLIAAPPQQQQQQKVNNNRLTHNHQHQQLQKQQRQQQQQQQQHHNQLQQHLTNRRSACCTSTSSQRNTNEFTCKRLLENLLHRYIRMMPLMMAIIGLSATLLRYLGEGPAWENSTIMFDRWCRQNWWINGLFLHNFLQRENMCLSHSWYSAVDIQLFLIGQLILLVLFRSRRLGLLLCFSLLLTAPLITATFTLIYHLPAVPLMISSVSEQSLNVYYGEIYIKPYCRASPYLIGILLAYLMRTTWLGQVRLKKWQVAAGWTASIGLIAAILLAMLPTVNGRPGGELWAAAYSALSRPLWACATGWMIWACITNQGGPFAWLLSARLFHPFSKLTYPAFLVHPIVMALFYGRQEPARFSHYLMLYLILGHIVITYVSAFLLSALFELPLLQVERVIKRTWRT